MTCMIGDIIKTVLIATCLVWVVGCGGSGGGSGGGSNSSASVPDHPVDGWADPAQHGVTAKAAPGVSSGFSYCQKCHGSNFTGGDVNVSCFTCHGVNAPHSPAPWRNGIRTHISTYGTNAEVCELCHTNGANSTLKPSPFAAGTEPGCFNNTLCHDQRGHEAGWTGNAIYTLHGSYVGANGTSKCSNQYCHGTSLTGVSGSGPSCSTCHTWPYTPGLLTCTFCHDYPPIAGKHTKHMALPNVDCSACHNGAGDNTEYHYNGTVEVFFAQQYNSKSGTASFDANAKKCSNISCHGGPRTQTSPQGTNIPPVSTPSQTPDWLNGSITVNTQCNECHVRGMDAEYNSYYSGKHKQHVFDENILCTECHDTTALSVSHFTNLDTPDVSGAAATIYADINYNGHYCMVTCHGLEHDDGRWW